MTLWNIWQRRNDAVWEGSLCDYELVIRRGDSFFQDWDRAKEAYKSRDISVEDVIQNRLIPLVHGRLKCNVDAAFLKETNSTGFGLRLRDPQVRMVVLRSCCVKPCMQFVEVEAYGLMLALQFVSNL